MNKSTKLQAIEAEWKQLSSAHYNKLGSIAPDLMNWLEQLRQINQKYYLARLEELGEQDGEEAEREYIRTDTEYAAVMSALQAAQERFVEATGHMKIALLRGDPLASMLIITEGYFK